ncbi:hypothetical protein [Paraglaciecola sp. L3A3]|uniref:hypothetical protein n=1 Tax=Paraglaciecola sp. L3A3 TaxID=2686358 RepID=UPI00131E90BF|nr:hypothetical protein [Paraglaciecola sp. L3A3]
MKATITIDSTCDGNVLSNEALASFKMGSSFIVHASKIIDDALHLKFEHHHLYSS